MTKKLEDLISVLKKHEVIDASTKINVYDNFVVLEKTNEIVITKEAEPNQKVSLETRMMDLIDSLADSKLIDSIMAPILYGPAIQVSKKIIGNESTNQNYKKTNKNEVSNFQREYIMSTYISNDRDIIKTALALEIGNKQDQDPKIKAVYLNQVFRDINKKLGYENKSLRNSSIDYEKELVRSNVLNSLANKSDVYEKGFSEFIKYKSLLNEKVFNDYVHITCQDLVKKIIDETLGYSDLSSQNMDIYKGMSLKEATLKFTNI